MIAVADTSFVLACANKRDDYHQSCPAVYKRQRTILLPQTTITEIAYMLRRGNGNTAVVFFLNGLPASKYVQLPLENQDFARTSELLKRYADSRVDFIDASIVAIAERLKIIRALTLDRRDFQMMRPRHVEHLELMPDR